jgi:hypothetical protein
VLLQFFDLVTDRGSRDEQLFGSDSEAVVAGGDFENTQRFQGGEMSDKTVPNDELYSSLC